MNQAWLHHTHAGYSVSQKVLNATEKCLREQLAKAQEQRESSAEHRRRVALCNCVKKLLLLLSSRAQLFLLLRDTSTVWVLMRADPLPRPPQVDNDDDLPNYLSMLFTCILLVSVTKPLFIQETMRSNAYSRSSNDAIAWLGNETKALVATGFHLVSWW